MPFIGNKPADSYLTLEKQTFTTSATDTYSLDREVSSVNDIELFLNNVRQEPTEAYTISGTTLTLASAITASDSMYCIYQGRSVGTTKPADNTITSAMIVDNAITSSKIASGAIANQSAYRNLIINGDMSIDQRNQTTTINGTGVTYNVDRFLGRGVSSAGVFTLVQDTDAPERFTNSLKATVTTADSSIASGSSYRVQHFVEGNNSTNLYWGNSSAQTVTLSFYVKSSVTGTFGGNLANGDFNRFNVFSYTINSANTWERKTISITGDTSGTWLTNNGLGIRINWSLGAGSTLLASAGSWGSSVKEGVTSQTNLIATNSATWQITGVQLEVGTSASDFEFLPYDVNLNRCMRYYQTYQSGGMICWSGTTISGANYFQDVRHVVPMRTSATIGNLTVENRNGFNTSNPSIDYGNTQGFRATLQSNANTNEAYFRFKYTADAEL